jgi:positive regulator of sigma E activity
MSRWHPKYILFLGIVLVFLGFLLPFLMVTQVIKSTLFLNFFSFIASVLGLFLGFVGAAMYTRMRG